jgi:16S rRNA (guanine1207-N2)-methyltransferase
MAAEADPALQALFLPFDSGALQWPADGAALFLRARDGWPLHAYTRPALDCTQPFKPAADALQRSGLTLVDEDEVAAGRYGLVLVLPPRQRDESRALFARALSLLRPGGVVVASMPNDEGARTGEADLARLAGPLGVVTKHHCRVFWSRPLAGAADPSLQAEWARLDAPRMIAAAEVPGGRFLSRPGVFAWDRVDPASILLAAHLPRDLAGQGADLGAGWGFLSAHVLAHSPAVAALDLFEADARALALARSNLAALSTTAALGFHWHDVTMGLPRQYDFLVSNPPFHALGRGERPDVGRAFIAAAAAALKPGGRFWLVANRHLPYEAVLDASFGAVETIAQQGGFKVVAARKAAAQQAAPSPPARRRTR